MKLSEHTEHIRQLIDKAFRNRLGRMGISNSSVQPIQNVAPEYLEDRKRVDIIRPVFISETGNENDAFEKLIEEFTFTLFNRIAALKVMEAHTLHPEIITKRTQHGDRAFSHLLWLEQNPEGRNEDQEGLIRYFLFQLEQLSNDIPLFSPKHPYHLLPTPVELNAIINAFNEVEQDAAVGRDIWQSDDVLGWLYESYNNYKKAAHKESGDKTEFNKVSIQSQVYTPKWVVKFLVDNSLGKAYLEMFPDSEIRRKYKIASAPKTTQRERKPITEIKLIDPATGSGNFLLYAFDLFYDLYVDQIDNYGANYDSRKIPELIIQNNLHGIDLDDRAVQLAQLGLFIKAKRKKSTAKIESFNLVSSDFYLPPYEEVKEIFEANSEFDAKQQEVIRDIWGDLQNAYKFGALIRLEEKLNFHFHGLLQDFQSTQIAMFTEETLANFEQFRLNFFTNLQKAVTINAAKQGITFLNSKTQDAITFLQLLTQKYDVLVANPPYTDSSDFGRELKAFVDANYKDPYKFNSNLYSAFIKRAFELTNIEGGRIGMLHPLTFMYISSYSDVRKYILANNHIHILNELGLGGVFLNSDVQADVVAYIIESKKVNISTESIFLDFKKYKNHNNKNQLFESVYENLVSNVEDPHIYKIAQDQLKQIEGSPFIYWISEGFRKKFKDKTIGDEFDVVQGLATANNERFTRFWWEVDSNNISQEINEEKKWYYYSKGGPFCKWYGNNWAIVNWENDGSEIKDFRDEKGKQKSRPQNEKYYKRKGITYTRSGSKGASFRIHQANYLFDVGGACIFSKGKYDNYEYTIAFLNSILSKYILDCLNPTVNTTEGDTKRVPFVIPHKNLESKIEVLATENIDRKIQLCSYRIIERNFKNSPLIEFKDQTVTGRILSFTHSVNTSQVLILLNEHLINNLIFDVYDLADSDKQQIKDANENSIFAYPIPSEAKESFFAEIGNLNKDLKNLIDAMQIGSLSDPEVNSLKLNFDSLYNDSIDFEQFCINNKTNPITAWYYFNKFKIVPSKHSFEITLEFLINSFRDMLQEDHDGIIPLYNSTEEKGLLVRFENYIIKNGFTTAHFSQIENLLNISLEEFCYNHFFIRFSEHIKLFKQLPCTPFIWHISSGKYRGFDAYTLIYKWSKDTLFKLKSHYVSKRKESLEFREIQLVGSETAQAQAEKELIRNQLIELDAFVKKIEDLIEVNYDPILDDGVGKNIAPLQKIGILRAEILNKKQMENYLNADW